MSISPVPEEDAAGARERGRRAARAVSAIGIALALVAAAYVAAWIYVAIQVREGVAAWAAAQRSNGFDVRYGTVTLGGFPGAIHAALESPSIEPIGGVWKWRASAATVAFAPWAPERVRVFAPGPHAVTAPGPGGIPETWQGQAREFVIEIAHVQGRMRTASAVATDLSLRADRSTLEFSAAEVSASVSQPPTTPAAHRDENAVLVVGAKDARLPVPPVPGLGRNLSRLALEARLLGVLDARLLGPLGSRSDAASPKPRMAALAAWRDSGGTVEIARFEAALGPLALSADGTLALDAAMQPIGAFTARLEGFIEAIDALREAGLVRGRDAVTAKVLLGALAKRESNGRLSLAVPLTAQERRLYVGPVALLPLPEVTW